MKRLLKYPLKAVWRLTAPLRRPILRRYEAMLVRCCAQAQHHEFHLECHVTPETNLVMEHLLRELVRLQDQIDHLQTAVESLALAPATTGLAVVGGIDSDDIEARTAAG
jgi:hypothetical protein